MCGLVISGPRRSVQSLREDPGGLKMAKNSNFPNRPRNFQNTSGGPLGIIVDLPDWFGAPQRAEKVLFELFPAQCTRGVSVFMSDLIVAPPAGPFRAILMIFGDFWVILSHFGPRPPLQKKTQGGTLQCQNLAQLL